MVIKSLKLKNYRNYDFLDLNFDTKTNILYVTLWFLINIKPPERLSFPARYHHREYLSLSGNFPGIRHGLPV